MVVAAYPYINVTIDTRGLQPKATRAVGNVGIVGSTGGAGAPTANVPILISSEVDARDNFTTTNAAGAVTASGRLYQSIVAALQQDPPPSRVYAVATDDSSGSPDYASALAALEAAPVQFVMLAGETDPDELAHLASHVENVSAGGNRRMAVAMVDPALTVADDSTFAATAEAAYEDIKSGSSRMVLIAGRTEVDGDGHPTSDLAAAAMGTIAGQPPQASALMKQLRGARIPLEAQFSPSEIREIAEELINPVIDPELIVGEGLYLGAGRTYTTDTSRLYVDIVRVLDHIEFLLKAGLIGTIGNTRIDRLGVQSLQARIEGILSPLRSSRMIDDYSIYIPILPTLAKEEAERSPGEATVLTDSRLSRTVEVLLSVTYAGSIHTLDINLALKA